MAFRRPARAGSACQLASGANPITQLSHRRRGAARRRSHRRACGYPQSVKAAETATGDASVSGGQLPRATRTETALARQRAARTTELSLTCVTKWCRKRSRRSAFVSASGAFERREGWAPGRSIDPRRRRPGLSGPVLDTSCSLRVSDDCVAVSGAGFRRLFCRTRSLIVQLEGGCGGHGAHAAGLRPRAHPARPLTQLEGAAGDRAAPYDARDAVPPRQQSTPARASRRHVTCSNGGST